MFNQLSYKQQQDVERIVGMLDDQDLRPLTTVLIGDDNLTEHYSLVRDMVAHIVVNNDWVADELDDTLSCVAEALTFTTTIMANYIKRGDTVPIEYVSDVFTLVSTSHGANYYWQTIIKDNLDLMANSVLDGKNVSTAIFKAVLNTAFDCVMAD